MRDRWLSIHAFITAGLSTGAPALRYRFAVLKLTLYVLAISFAVFFRRIKLR
jgi:hypothetical protein